MLQPKVYVNTNIDFLIELWKRNYNEFIDDIFIREIIHKINKEMNEGEALPQTIEEILEK